MRKLKIDLESLEQIEFALKTAQSTYENLADADDLTEADQIGWDNCEEALGTIAMMIGGKL